MYIQIKSIIAPPDEKDEAIIVSSKSVTAIKHKNHWIYEAPNEALELDIPDFLEDQPFTITINDAECTRLEEVRLICTKEGHPLVPYYVSDITSSSKNSNKELNQLLEALGMSSEINIDARFSISFPYASVTFNNKLFMLNIEEYTRKIVPGEKTKRRAIVETKPIYSGPVRVGKLYCSGCQMAIDVSGYSSHERHGVKFSEFEEMEKLPQYAKVIRAAYKKTMQRGSGAIFIEKRK
jgi:hypothetical protein